MTMHDFYNRLIDIDTLVNLNASKWVVGTLMNQLHKDIMSVQPETISLLEYYDMIDEFLDTYDNLNKHYNGELHVMMEYLA